MAPRTTLSTPPGPASHVISGVIAPMGHKKPLQHTALTTQKARLALREQIVRAVQDGHLIFVQQTLQHTGPSVPHGSTLLHVAAESNQPQLASFLMRFISPNAVNAKGYTPVHVAAMKGHTQVLNHLLRDPYLDADKRDSSGYTYKHWLCAPLFDAVLKWDKVKISSLLSVGADPDQEAGRVVGGALVRELGVTTARQLARALAREPLVRMLGKTQASGNSSQVDPDVTSGSLSAALDQLPMGSLRLQVAASEVLAGEADVYQTNNSSPGYVCLLNYGAFKDRQDLLLEGSEADAHNLATVFSKMGYSGHTHFSLTADETRQELTRLRGMEEVQQAACLVFVISSHGAAQEQFLTSDMKLLRMQWVLDLFKDSQCPQLKDKPKLFIWDLCHGYYRGGNTPLNTTDHGRVDEPLRNVLCLHSNSGCFSPYTFTRDGTPFTKTLCRTLARHAHHKEFSELYKAFLGEYAKAAPGVVPRLTNIGFSRKFYFNPRPGSSV